MATRNDSGLARNRVRRANRPRTHPNPRGPKAKQTRSRPRGLPRARQTRVPRTARRRAPSREDLFLALVGIRAAVVIAARARWDDESLDIHLTRHAIGPLSKLCASLGCAS